MARSPDRVLACEMRTCAKCPHSTRPGSQLPLAGNRGVASASKRHLEIGGEHADLVPLRFHQDVGENRDRVLAFNDALKKLQFSQKLVFPDYEFHIRGDLEAERLVRREGASQSGSYVLN